MKLSYIIVSALLLYSILSMVYVYRWRGNTRYVSLSQYLRKSWPVFAPLNCMLYMTTSAKARQPLLDANYLQNIDLLRENWSTIRDEALALQAIGIFDSIKTPGSVGYYDVGFRTFYKRGWSKFYLKWYGTTHNSAQRLCPKTLELLNLIPGIKGAMFAVLPPGSELTLHADPMASSLRYHLGLATPNSEDCFINVDGVCCSWVDGKDFVFDETYPHFAKNNTEYSRLILMCDVERPVNMVGKLVNMLYRIILKGTLVANLPEDKRGFFSTIFAAFAPLQRSRLKLRNENRSLYKILKIVLNSFLLVVFVLIIFGFFRLFESLLTGFSS
jgi:beta-hydroxylase